MDCLFDSSYGAIVYVLSVMSRLRFKLIQAMTPYAFVLLGSVLGLPIYFRGAYR